MRRVVYCRDFHPKRFEIRPFLIVSAFPFGHYPRGQDRERVRCFAERVENMRSNATYSSNSDFHRTL